VNQPSPSPGRPSATPTTTPETLTIDVVKEPLVDGCGCYLQKSDDAGKEDKSYIFLSSDIAQMNLDGKDIRLELVKSVEQEGETKVGSTRSEYYKSGNIDVGIEYVVKGICPPNDEGCESTEYSATITVTRNGVYKKISALGYCGC